MSAEPVFATIDHASFVADVRALGAAIATDGWAPTLIAGIARGGLAPAVYLSHLTSIAMCALDPMTAVELDAIAARTRSGGRVLLIDDINDSGRTFALLRDGLAAAGAAMAGIRAAALIDNIGSSERIDYRARAIDRADDKRWFVFPWEAMAPRAMLVADALVVPERLGDTAPVVARREDARRSP